MPSLTGVVKQLIIINAILFVMARLIFPGIGEYLVLYYPASEFFQPYQLLTHMFMHADLMHIFFNMYALYLFGTALEALWGSKKFLIFYFITGFGAVALHMLVWYLELTELTPTEYARYLTQPHAVLGASGAVFGILAGFALKFPNVRLMLIIPPIPIKAWVFVLIYAALELYLGLSRSQTGVAHWAHLGGALFGVIMTFIYNRNNNSGQLR